MKAQQIRMAVMCLFSASLLISSTVNSQESEQRVKLKNLPKAVQKAVREQSKGARVRGLSKEVEKGETYYEVELLAVGHNKDVLIDPSGVVVEIEEEVPLASLPLAVMAQIESQAGKGKILTVESISKAGTLVTYEAHVSKAGKKSEIKVAPDGKLITPESEKR